MKIKVLSIALLLFLASCKAEIKAGEMVLMPKGYSVEQTSAFLKDIVNDDLKRAMYENFPDIKNHKGGFRYKPVHTKSFTGGGKGSGVIVKINGLENWDKKNEFEQFLLSYLKNEKSKLQKE